MIALTDLRRRLRNRSAIVTAFVAPILLGSVFGILIGNAGKGTFAIGIVDLDGSAASRSVVAGVLAEPAAASGVRFERLAGRAAARARVDGGHVDAAIVLPAGFGARLAAGRAGPLVVLRRPDRPVGGQVGEAVALSVAARTGEAALAVRTASALRGRPPDAALLTRAAAAGPGVVLGDVGRGRGEVSTAAYYGASMSILFLFFTIAFAARSILADRASGTLARILATPTRPAAVLAGKTLAVAVLGFAGLLSVWAVTALAFDAHWGDPLGVVVVMLGTVVAVGGVSMLIASLARTDQQADAYTSAVTFAFALLGGNFIQPGAMPPVLRALSLATPNGWALRAFTDLGADATDLSAVAGTLGVLLAIGVVAGGLGAVRVHGGMRG